MDTNETKKPGRITGRSTMISARVNTFWLTKLDALAKADERSRSQIIDRAIEEYVKRHEQKPKPAK
jgi:predicted transcriptional regulator